MSKIHVRQVRSAIGRHSSQAQTLKGLGLGRISREKKLEDTKAIRGMIDKVRHLLEVDGNGPSSERQRS